MAHYSWYGWMDDRERDVDGSREGRMIEERREQGRGLACYTLWPLEGRNVPCIRQ